jgi:hypothetical protein
MRQVLALNGQVHITEKELAGPAYRKVFLAQHCALPEQLQ